VLQWPAEHVQSLQRDFNASFLVYNHHTPLSTTLVAYRPMQQWQSAPSSIALQCLKQHFDALASKSSDEAEKLKVSKMLQVINMVVDEVGIYAGTNTAAMSRRCLGMFLYIYIYINVCMFMCL
jgi:hypothetical protein